MVAKRQKDSQAVPVYAAAYHRPFPKREPWAGPTEYGTMMSKLIRERLKQFIRKKPDKSWAPKLLKRFADGEPICMYAVEQALMVVGQKPEREPGSDDE